MNRPTFLRRSTALLLTLVLMVCAALPGFAAYQMPIQTASDTESVYLFNLDTGKPILRQNSDQQRYIASLTKMMTALLFLESGKDMNAEITIPTSLTQEKVVSVQPSSLARAFIWATKAVRSPPETSLAMTLAASLALATSRP